MSVPSALKSFFMVNEVKPWQQTEQDLNIVASSGVYNYFYHIFINILEHKRKRINDRSINMFSSLVVATLARCVNVLCTNLFGLLLHVGKLIVIY